MGHATVIVLTIITDQLSKYMALRFGCYVSFNSGTAFGLFKDCTVAVTVMAVVALGCMLLAIFFLRAFAPAVVAGLALVAGGAASNIIDRIARGSVLDWLVLPLSERVFKGGLFFNLADIAIGLGLAVAVAAIVLAELRKGR